MSTDVQSWIQQSLQGDPQAFGKIVAHYQGAVSAMAYSITGNLAQSEDLAQEAFIIAWRKLGGLQQHESLAPWLCGIVRNLARDWVRKQAKQPTLSADHLHDDDHPAGPSPDEESLQRERADLVWGALTEIPENYRDPLILFYRQGESIRAIAEVLELSEDAVKQRLSRGRKMLRAEVESLVESTLTDTRPGKAFTLAVVGALPALYGAKAIAAEIAGANATAAASTTAMGALLKLALPIAVVAALTGLWLARGGLGAVDGGPVDTGGIAHDGKGDDSAIVGRAVRPPLVLEPTVSKATNASVATTRATLAGTVVIRGTDEAAPGMRVVYGREDIGLTDTVTDDAGRFSFEGVSAGQYTVLAYDANYDEMPEDNLRSEHYLVTVVTGAVPPGLRIEVPPIGQPLTGRVTDAKSGVPLADIRIAAFGLGIEEAEGEENATGQYRATRNLEGRSDGTGRYQILGLSAGQWRVHIDRDNPIFTNDSPNEMELIAVKADTPATLDFALDCGVPIRGIVVDREGDLVPEARIGAELYLTSGFKHDCYFKADAEGTFTVWGARPGDKAVLRASKDALGSFIEVVQFASGEVPERVTLTLLPKSTVSGRFVDEEGRAVEAQFWSQPRHPDVPHGWTGQSDRAATFSAEFVPGPYEIKGLAKGVILSTIETSQTLDVGTDPIDGLVVSVTTVDPDAGSYSLSGRVTNEQGQPLQKCRLYMYGDGRATLGVAPQETRTDEQGRFLFEGLVDGPYRVHATPGGIYEAFAGYEKLNPAETPEVTIVVRQAPILRGRVVDGNTGEPVTDFHVDYGGLDVHDREQWWGPDSPSIHAESGEFSFPARLDEDWFIRVSARGYAPQRVTGGPLKSGIDPDVITFKLMASRVVQGTVVDGAGDAVPRALVYLNSGFINGATKSTNFSVAESDSEGRFTVDSISAEIEYLYIWKKGYAAVREPIAESVQAILHEGGIVEGRVTVNGAVPEGELTVYARSPETADSTFGKIAPGGLYRMENLMDSAYQFQVTIRVGDEQPGRYFIPDELVEVRHDMPLTHDIDVPVGATVIEGLVLDKGQPVDGVEIQCRNGSIHVYTTTDQHGAYRFEGLQSGPVILAVHLPDEAPSTTPYHEVAVLEIAADQTTQHDIDLSR